MLETYGWSPELQQAFAPHAEDGLVPARVIAQHRGAYQLMTSAGETRAEISGRLARDADPGGYPAAGDWVAAEPPARDGPAIIHAVMPRRTAFIRKVAGRGGEAQVVAANVDVAFLVASLNADLNPRRLERYLAAAWQSGAAPVILLTKADISPDPAAAAANLEAAGAPVHILSSLTGEGLDAVRAYLKPGVTAVMVGSSGAGKSTLANVLLGAERMVVGAIREDDARGRHTTSHRELILLPGGGLLLDTPGMRELALVDAEEGVSATFEDIEALAAACRFSNCGHESEPGCAVRAALEAGELDEGRWRSWRKLGRELEHLARREDPVLREQNRRRWVQIHKANRARYKSRERE
ncbi:MAG TPA: ribosome small subunit-dependent GTPase A [Caulobacteraceae bacterium]|nr:ribosome small subunit-dependent GTPase A [Caulobacteraceae bacterium]